MARQSIRGASGLSSEQPHELRQQQLQAFVSFGVFVVHCRCDAAEP
jgi:hypothetical protein